jgi:hypothetical protein
MGENRAKGEFILGSFIGEEACYVEDDHLSITQNTACLHSFYADNLKCVQSKTFGYNKFKSSSTLEAALMVKSVNGDRNYDC